MLYRKTVALLCPVLIGLLVCLQPQTSLAQHTQNRLFTSNEDFAAGTLFNLQNTNGQLSVNTPPHKMFPYVNIACSGRGTVTRIFIGSGGNPETTPPYVVGEYWTSPNGMQRNPSRTTVDHAGNTWVANRDEGGVSGGVYKGSITRVALAMWNPADSATVIDHESPDGHSIYLINPANLPDPSKLYLSMPFDRLDRDHDGFIRTSKGLGHILSWSNDNNIDKDGGGTLENLWGVNTADDELIANYTRVDGTAARTMAIDIENNLWVGGFDNNVFQKINGGSGLPFDPNIGLSPNCGSGAYGGLIDHLGQLWSVEYSSGVLLRYTAQESSPVQTCFGDVGNYGIAIDPLTGYIWETTNPGSLVYEIDPETGLPLHSYSQGFQNAQGIAVDGKGHVWIAQAHGSAVYHLAPDPNTSGHYALGAVMGFNGTTGVAVDANGKIWVSEESGNSASRIDPNPASQTADANGNKLGVREAIQGALPISLDYPGYVEHASPYNYSDMTGFVAQQPTWQGRWTVIHDGGVTDGTWDRIQWNTENSYQPDPSRTRLIVRIRTADSQDAFTNSTVPYTRVNNNDHLCQFRGRYMQVQVTFKGSGADPTGFLTPILYDLEIIGYDAADDTDPADGVTDACQRIIYVKSDAAGSNNGSDWTNAFTTMHAAMFAFHNEVAPDTQIWVAAGTYIPGTNSNDTIELMNKRAIYGGFSGQQGTERNFASRNPTLYPTILSGILGVNRSNHILKATDADATTILDGFIIADGGTSSHYGGGLLLSQSNPTIRNCRFLGNAASSGGAIANQNGSSPTIINCVFNYNTATTGGAIFNEGSSNPQIVNCLFVANKGTGAAIASTAGCSPTLVNCTLVYNTAKYYGHGGAIYNGQGCTATIKNCILWHNYVRDICDFAAQVHNDNATSPPSINYSCVEGYSGGGTGNTNSYPSFIRMPYPGPENWALSDNYVTRWDGQDDDLGNVRIRRGSVCVDAGDNAAVPTGLDYDLAGARRKIDGDTNQSVVVDMGAYEVDPSSTDCNGNLVNDAIDISSGTSTDCNDSQVPDECENLIWQDFDHDDDCDVDANDFAFFQRCITEGATGGMVSVACRGMDFDFNGHVDMSDLEVFADCGSGSGIVPRRDCSPQPQYYPMFGGDYDDDGVLDTSDNCPAIFNTDQADADEDGVGDACDNCVDVDNSEQTNADNDGLGDACDTCTDTDGDGYGDPGFAANTCGTDNCPAVSNSDQTDTDIDGIGDACDNCVDVANTNQADADEDGLGDACDNCPGVIYPDASDYDDDGVGDVCDNCWEVANTNQTDTDNDLVGDACDNCPAVENFDQDDLDGDGVGDACDNCPETWNPDQADTDSNGIGDECESQQQGMSMPLGEEFMMMGMEEGGEILPVPSQGAFAYFVTHDGNESFSSVPASGGTVIVDVVVATADPLRTWEVWPAVDAANVISIDATGWSQQAELLTWAGLSSQQLPSYYRCDQLDWMVVDANDRVVCRGSVNNAECVNRLLEPGAIGYTAWGLDMLDGDIYAPISSLAEIAIAGGYIPTGGFYTTALPLSSLTATTLESGAIRVATLTLQVAGTPGTYHLRVANGSYHSATTGQQEPMQPGPVFEIQVGGQ